VVGGRRRWSEVEWWGRGGNISCTSVGVFHGEDLKQTCGWGVSRVLH